MNKTKEFLPEFRIFNYNTYMIVLYKKANGNMKGKIKTLDWSQSPVDQDNWQADLV